MLIRLFNVILKKILLHTRCFMSNKGIGKGLAALLGNMKEEETIAEKANPPYPAK